MFAPKSFSFRPIAWASLTSVAALSVVIACGGKSDAKSPEAADASGTTEAAPSEVIRPDAAAVDSSAAATAPGTNGEPGRRREDIQAIVQARRDEIRACYDAGLKEHPGIEGNLDVKWTIDPEGRVTDIAVDTTSSQIVEPSVGSCVINIIKKIEFAPSVKGFETRTHYPFNFRPRFAPTRTDTGK
jgi:outer membrane biosynthesis protein TonB